MTAVFSVVFVCVLFVCLFALRAGSWMMEFLISRDAGSTVFLAMIAHFKQKNIPLCYDMEAEGRERGEEKGPRPISLMSEPHTVRSPVWTRT